MPARVDIQSVAGEEEYDFVQAFAFSKVELKRLVGSAFDAVKQGTLLWFCYPKKSSKVGSNLSRNDSWGSGWLLRCR